MLIGGYLFFSFVMDDFNPLNWPPGTIEQMAIAFTVAGAIITGFNYYLHRTMGMILLCISLSASAQKKWYNISKNDIAIMSIEVAAGYAQGWRDEVQYHPNQLFKQMPNLNRRFWDIRHQDPPTFLNMEWDADHALKFAVNGLHVTAVVLKVGDIKQYRKKDRWKKIIFDAAKYYLSYKAGFFLSYNITHKNKF